MSAGLKRVCAIHFSALFERKSALLCTATLGHVLGGDLKCPGFWNATLDRSIMPPGTTRRYLDYCTKLEDHIPDFHGITGESTSCSARLVW